MSNADIKSKMVSWIVIIFLKRSDIYMINRMKSLVLAFSMLTLMGSVNLASAATTPEIETLLNWAEGQFSQLFPSHQATQMIDPWAFRFYPSTGIYAGVNNNQVFVLGGPWGTDSPTFIDTLPNLLAQIPGSGGSGSVPACSNTAEIPAGMVVTQSGNVVNVTTNGQCITLPTNTNFCESPAQSQPTGISALSTFNTTSSQVTGMTGLPPELTNTILPFANSLTTCTINAPAENPTVSMDICFDVTDQLADIPSDGFGITIVPPVTFAMAGTTTTQIVLDCLSTDAAVVNDAFTGETWTRDINGNLVSVGF
jgi:hypothetical protein